MAAIPKPASTVVLLDRNNRVYMTKRPHTMKFLGGYFVFPGGAVEREDEHANEQYIKVGDERNELPLSYYIAAARELFEEIGILLCEKNIQTEPLPDYEKAMAYRKQLLDGDISFCQLLKKEEMYLCTSRLNYFGNLVTPERSPIRFNTRFFLAYLPDGQQPMPDPYEIEEGLWVTPEEALSAYRENRMPMVLPTITTLNVIQDYLHGNPLKMPEIILE